MSIICSEEGFSFLGSLKDYSTLLSAILQAQLIAKQRAAQATAAAKATAAQAPPKDGQLLHLLHFSRLFHMWSGQLSAVNWNTVNRGVRAQSYLKQASSKSVF